MYICSVCVCTSLNNNMFICKKCQYNSCKKCCKKYLLCIANKEPCCMNCDENINKFDLIKIFGIKWVFGRYMKYKNEIIFKNQLSLLQSTKGEADMNKKENIIIAKKKKLLIKRKKINKELGVLNAELIQLRRSYLENDIILRRFSCSFCEGFLDGSYKCTICSKNTCEKCYSIKNEDHMCFDNSINILEKCKDCPNCGEFMTKDDGCRLIKCIKCNTIFDWNNKEIISNIFEVPNNNFNIPILIDYKKINISSYSYENIITIRGIYEHINEFIRFKSKKYLSMLNVNILNFNIDRFKTYRIEYINNNINKKQFYKKIIKIYKFENYKQYIIYIILCAYKKAIEIFNNGCDYLNELNFVINDTNNYILNITKYFKYSNNIKILHWFNINDIDKIIK